MNNAELKTLRESLGFSQQFIGNYAGVARRTVQYWENSDNEVKPDVKAFLIEIHALYKKIIDNAIKSCVAKKQLDGNYSVTLIRYKNDEDLHFFVKEFECITAQSHATLLQRLKDALEDLNIDCRIVYMHKSKYFFWLYDDSKDSEENRRLWASMQ
jgi:transcriptional regulator with XRE-family HTH domain